MKHKIFKTLNKLEKTHIGNIKHYESFLIYYYILELIVKRYFEKLIIENLLTSDLIVEFLERNEFGLKNNEIYKKDIIDETTFYGELSNVDVAKTIKKDFEKILLDEITESNILIDIENYLNIMVDIENETRTNIRIYSIYIRYYRNQLILDYKNMFYKKLIKLFGFILMIILTIFFVGKYTTLF